MPPATNEFTVNDRTYRPPARPVAVICIDGCADEYLDTSLALGRMPRLARLLEEGSFRAMARGALPSFTNVNNSSITTGVPPAVHGISGNFFLDPETGEEVMMNSPSYLRCGTILAAAAQAGRKVAMVTAKEKLRDILSHELDGIAFSAEMADQASEGTHGISGVEELVGEPAPEIYSAAASLFVLKAGAALIEREKADFLYLSLTDYMQHKFTPEDTESLDFYAALDHELGRLLDLGAVVGATADHGMNSKQTIAGEPNVIYLESLLSEELKEEIKVILPITDPYVLHHGALGSLACVHLPDCIDAGEIISRLLKLDGITEAYDRATAARKLELPADRIGDVVVLSGRDVVIGRTPDYHDLAAIQEGLRSHGGRYEEMVPFLLSEKINAEYSRRTGDLRNFDIFEFTTNGIQV